MKNSIKEPIRILEMTASLYTGGSQMMIVNLYKNIDRSKIQFDFIIDHPKLIDLKETVEALGAKVYVMPTFKIYNILEVKNAWRNFFKEHPEYKVIHSHSRSYAVIYLKIAKQCGLKTIIHSHNTSNGKGLVSKIKNVFQTNIKNVADYFIGCSKQSGEWLFGKEIVNSDRFYILNNAIDANIFRYNPTIRKKYRKEFNINNEKIYIQVGELNEQKNHKFTLDVFKELVKIKPDSKLYIVGNGELKLLIEKTIVEYGLQNNVVMLGRRTDVSELLQMADYYMMPSNFEGLSVAAIEAQASGIECILSDRCTSDVKISDNLKFVALDVNSWVKELCKELPTRKDTYDNIVKAGYEISSTAKWIQEFYIKINNE